MRFQNSSFEFGRFVTDKVTVLLLRIHSPKTDQMTLLKLWKTDIN